MTPGIQFSTSLSIRLDFMPRAGDTQIKYRPAVISSEVTEQPGIDQLNVHHKGGFWVSNYIDLHGAATYVDVCTHTTCKPYAHSHNHEI